MKVFLGQIYVTPGMAFPFSSRMQRWLGERLTLLTSRSAKFTARFGPGFDLMIRISAEGGTKENRIVGPTVFKKQGHVEFTVFLPYDLVAESEDGRKTASEYLLQGVRSVFQAAGVESGDLDTETGGLLDHLRTSADVLKDAWSPQRETR